MRDPEATNSTAISRESDLDFVCNEFVMYEKALQSGVPKFRPFRTSDHTFLIQGGFILIMVFLIGTAVIAACSGRGVEALTWSTMGLLLASLLGYKQIPRLLKPFPTNIIFGADGMRLAWRFRNTTTSEAIPWDAIMLISAGKSWTGSGTAVRIDVSLPMVPRAARLPLVLQSCSLWTRNVPWIEASGRIADTLSLQLPFDALTLDADEFRLIAALRSRVDPAVLTPEFIELFDSNKAPTFTQLWLDDMQSFRRNRIEELPVGATLQDGKYAINEKIATGGQAKIYSAIDTQTNQAVAVKELVLPIHAGAEVRNRAFGNVKNEALILSTLDHPGIVKLLDNFVEDHRAYLVLEHISGRTLRKIVQEDGPFATDEIFQITVQICNVLEYLHGLSPPIVHRDLTPDNLMLRPDKLVRLLDFNVAQQLESNATKTVVGKHNYMAPEQFKGKPCTQSDLYSLGCTLNYLYTGADPLPLSSSRPSSICSSVPREMDDLIAKLTQPQLPDRYQTVAEVVTELSRMTSLIEMKK